MHQNNIFLTLTYSDEHLKSPRLQYLDFQLFMKRLREEHTKNISDLELKKEMFISYMVTGEYGDKNKRPHWHAIIFNYSPPDLSPHHTTDRGDKVYTSRIIDKLWGKNDPQSCPSQIGAVTLDSAGYVARYAAKKLTHGHDDEHDFHPIHKTSSKHAIGRTWIEKHYKQIFQLGFCRIPNDEKQKTKIPRYYVDWLKKNHKEEYLQYISDVRLKIQKESEEKARAEELKYLSDTISAYNQNQPRPITYTKMRLTILNNKFKKLQERLKL